MNYLWIIRNIKKDRLTNEARQYERELADVRRQKERVEEKMMAQYKSPSPPKKSKGKELILIILNYFYLILNYYY